MSNFDHKKYAGTWHELARLPIRKMEGLCDNTRSVYTRIGETFRINYHCTKKGKKEYKYNATLTPEGRKGEAKFRLVFDNMDGVHHYWVHNTDYENFSIVGGPDNQYLHIFGRKPQITKAWMNKLLDKAGELGYDANRIVFDKNVIAPASKSQSPSKPKVSVVTKKGKKVPAGKVLNPKTGNYIKKNGKLAKSLGL